MMLDLSFVARSEAETEMIGRMLALWIKPGSAIFLSGELGAGKSVLARAIVRAVTDEPDLDVPSPTFAIVQAYESARMPLLHVDLYRLSQASEIEQIGLLDLLASHAAIVEWPELLSELVEMQDMLAIAIAGEGDERRLRLLAKGYWAEALSRNSDVERFLGGQTTAGFERRHFQGDASTRRYELVGRGAATQVLMDMPERTDRRIVKNGKSYSELVHLADNIRPVIAINSYLHSLGYRAPEILRCDFNSGLALIEYLDGKTFFRLRAEGHDILEPMLAATEVLADMANRSWPMEIQVHGEIFHHIQAFDTDAQLTEVDLMPTWFWPSLHKAEAPQEVRHSFEKVWRALIAALPHEPVWMLRDFHSVNLIWMPDQDGIRRIGLIDTQDAVMGHAAYDLVSLIQDARHDISRELQDRLLQHYLDLRCKQRDFDATRFLKAYAISGAQRATRLLGTFTRLSLRDGKDHYLQHRPRNARYLMQNFEHEAVRPLRDWYELHAPEVLEIARK
jgi:N-acetylmuramate 1-kinase